MKKILGLDLGTNSIGWAVVKAEPVYSEADEADLWHQEQKLTGLKPVGIEAAGSRIIPMDAAVMGNFEKGNSVSQTKERRMYRTARRMNERRILRRERLCRVLSLMGFLPEWYACDLDRHGTVISGKEPRIAWIKDGEGRWRFALMDAFNEMAEEFRSVHPDEAGLSVPYDWTLYYLRKKALSRPVSKYELAWILLSFNQKRGYLHMRTDLSESEEDDKSKKEEYLSLKVVSVQKDANPSGKGQWWEVIFENGIHYRRTSQRPLDDWVGKTLDVVVTTALDKNGLPKRDKDGNELPPKVRVPGENDWLLQKLKAEGDIEKSGKTVGAYIYDCILHSPHYKVKGKIVRTIDRRFYVNELSQILETQKRFIPELEDRRLYLDCVEALYPHNDAHKELLAGKGFSHLFVEDILFYQRPLRSNKNLIGDCQYEVRHDASGGAHPVKCIAKSHPLFQEFRLWQFISNLRIYDKLDKDATDDFLGDNGRKAQLFTVLNDRKDIDEDAFLGLKMFGIPKEQKCLYRWNYLHDGKKYPCNETRYLFQFRLKKSGIDPNWLDEGRAERLWEILWSAVNQDEYGKALRTYAGKEGILDVDSFVKSFEKVSAFPRDYGSYSAKAIRKLLPLMRCGDYWNEDEIPKCVMERIDRIIDGEDSDGIEERAREKAKGLEKVEDFQGLPVWRACYVAYGRHSEARNQDKWNSPEDIDAFLASYRNGSLRNPVVEKVLLETIRVVRDIWKVYGKPDEIHVELGREIKNPANKRRAMSERNLANEKENLKIRALLTAFMNPEMNVSDVRPYSPSQHDILKLYEESVLDSVSDKPDDILEILKKFERNDANRPTDKEMLRYKCWLDQKYVSPYTGCPIPLSRLFTEDYQVDHVIPQSRYFDDSFSNKVICESAVNQRKDRCLAHEFICRNGGEQVDLGGGRTAKILYKEEFEKLVEDNYRHNRSKMKKLMLDDIPDGFIERQANDSAYISRVAKSMLSRIVRDDDEPDAISKHVVTCTGAITHRLKRDWGIKDVWNQILLPRFERLDTVVYKNEKPAFTAISSQGHLMPRVPDEYQNGFHMKRIDHRHHAMDAIVIACASRDHVNLLNNEAAKSDNKGLRYDLQHKLRRQEEYLSADGERKLCFKEFMMPWQGFRDDVKDVLDGIVVSFKENNRILTRTVNHYKKYVADGARGMSEKKSVVQRDALAVRKSLHKDTVFGAVNLRSIVEMPFGKAWESPDSVVDKELKSKMKELRGKGLDAKGAKQYFLGNHEIWSEVADDFGKVKKIKCYQFSDEGKDRCFATRFKGDLVSLFEDAAKKKDPLDAIEEANKRIEQITDTGIRSILHAHLKAEGDDVANAFSPDGIDRMNANIVHLNGGKNHMPINVVRRYEKSGNKFQVGTKGSKSSKFVEADKGTNLFLGVYAATELDKETGEAIDSRKFRTVALNDVVRNLKNGQPPVPLEDGDGNKLLFTLSPGDLVYLPDREERRSGLVASHLRRDGIYRVVSCGSPGQDYCDFLPASVASPIVDKKEYSPLNKFKSTDDKELIQKNCLKLRVDRLGRISVEKYD